MYRILGNNGTVVINELTGPKWLRRFMNWCFTKWPTGDHAVYSRAEIRLIREHTVAEGAGICDYRTVGDKVAEPK